MAKKEKKTTFKVEDKSLERGPRKPKGGGFHEDNRKKRQGNRSQRNKLNENDWDK